MWVRMWVKLCVEIVFNRYSHSHPYPWEQFFSSTRLTWSIEKQNVLWRWCISSTWTVTLNSLTEYLIKSCLSCKVFLYGPIRNKKHFLKFELNDSIETSIEFRFDWVEKRYQWKRSHFLFFIGVTANSEIHFVNVVQTKFYFTFEIHKNEPYRKRNETDNVIIVSEALRFFKKILKRSNEIILID